MKRVRPKDELRLDDVDTDLGTRWAQFKIGKADRLTKEFVSFANAGDAMLQLIAGLHTSRLASFGFTAEAEILGVDTYAVSEQLDNRICPVCYEMHGRVFRVSDARRTLDRVFAAQSPDDLRSLQPWPSQTKSSVAALRAMTAADIVGRNWHLPPYHPGCRGVLVHVNRVPKIQDLPSSQAALAQEQPVEQTRDVLRLYGIAGDLAAVQFWNRYVGTDAGSTLAALTGKLPTEVLEAGEKIADIRSGVTAGSRWLDIVIDASLYGSADKIKARFRWLPDDKIVSISGLHEATVLPTPMLDGWRDMFRRLSARQVSIDAGMKAEHRNRLIEYFAAAGMY